MKGRLVRGAARTARAVVSIAFVAVVTACSAFIDSPDVEIVDVRVTGVGLNGATAEVTLSVANPNGFALTSKALRYRLAFDDRSVRDEGDDHAWRTIAEGEHARAIRVGKDDSTRVTIPVPFSYSDVGRALRSLLSEGSLEYRLDGDVLFDGPLGDVRVPFDDTGHVGL